MANQLNGHPLPSESPNLVGLRLSARLLHKEETNLFINSLFPDGEVKAIVKVGVNQAMNVLSGHGGYEYDKLESALGASSRNETPVAP